MNLSFPFFVPFVKKQKNELKQISNLNKSKQKKMQISTHPLRQTLLDLANKSENIDQLKCYIPNFGSFRGVNVTKIKIDAYNKYEAVVLFYDYINDISPPTNDDLFGCLQIEIEFLLANARYNVDDQTILINLCIDKRLRELIVTLSNDYYNHVLK